MLGRSTARYLAEVRLGRHQLEGHGNCFVEFKFSLAGFVRRVPWVSSLLHEHVLEELAAIAGPLPPLDHVEVEHALWHQLVRLPHLVQQEQLLPADLEQADHAALAGVAEAVHQDVGGLLLCAPEPRSCGRESSGHGQVLELANSWGKRCTGAAGLLVCLRNRPECPGNQGGSRPADRHGRGTGASWPGHRGQLAGAPGPAGRGSGASWPGGPMDGCLVVQLKDSHLTINTQRHGGLEGRMVT